MNDFDQIQLDIDENILRDVNSSSEVKLGIQEEDVAKRALDELFTLTYQYKASNAYFNLLQFVNRFNFYSPFNAMLMHTQMPGAKYVATPQRWLKVYGRRIRFGARPLVILRPMGPVMFVFDVSDTEPTKSAEPLPKEIDKLFEVRSGKVGNKLEKLCENAKRDGIRINFSDEGSQSAGSIRKVRKGMNGSIQFQTGKGKNRKQSFIDIPVAYSLLVNTKLSSPSKYSTIVHELAHLYCGHLGTPDKKFWPDRHELSHKVKEFEAESVAYLVSSRAGIDNPSERYLAGYVKENEQVPPISLDCVMKVAGLIETMSKKKMKPRKQ